jgi:hypothetical protein
MVILLKNKMCKVTYLTIEVFELISESLEYLAVVNHIIEGAGPLHMYRIFVMKAAHSFKPAHFTVFPSPPPPPQGSSAPLMNDVATLRGGVQLAFIYDTVAGTYEYLNRSLCTVASYCSSRHHRLNGHGKNLGHL